MNHPTPHLKPVPAVGICTIIITPPVVISEQQDPSQCSEELRIS